MMWEHHSAMKSLFYSAYLPSPPVSQQWCQEFSTFTAPLSYFYTLQGSADGQDYEKCWLASSFSFPVVAMLALLLFFRFFWFLSCCLFSVFWYSYFPFFQPVSFLFCRIFGIYFLCLFFFQKGFNCLYFYSELSWYLFLSDRWTGQMHTLSSF